MASGARRRPRPGGHELSPEVIARFQRQRILDGAARAFAARGYRAVTVADIVKSAAIARARFYENFSSKEDCFFALYDGAVDDALAVVSEACASQQGEFPLLVRRGVEALISHLEANPELARACIVEGPAAGPGIGPRFDRMIAGFAELLRNARADADLPDQFADTFEETVVGGLYWLLYYALLETDGATGLDRLVPQLTEFCLVPFVGADGARAAVS